MSAVQESAGDQIDNLKEDKKTLLDDVTMQEVEISTEVVPETLKEMKDSVSRNCSCINQELQTASQEPEAARPTVPASTKVVSEPPVESENVSHSNLPFESNQYIASQINEPHAETPTIVAPSTIERKPEEPMVSGSLVVAQESTETKTEEPVAQESTETKNGKPMTPVSTDDPKVVQELAETKPEEPISTDDPNMAQDAIKINTEEPVAPVSTNMVGEATEAKTEEPAVTANDPMAIEVKNEQPKLSETKDGPVSPETQQNHCPHDPLAIQTKTKEIDTKLKLIPSKCSRPDLETEKN